MEKSNGAFSLSIANIFVFILSLLSGIPIIFVVSLVLCMFALEKINKAKKQGLLTGKDKTARAISYIILSLDLLFAIFVFIIPNLHWW